MTTAKKEGEVTRRSALGVLAGAIVVVGCGGNDEATSHKTNGSGGASGSGGAAGSPAGGGSGGTGGTTASGGTAGTTSTGGSAGTAGSGGSAGASSLACHTTGPTPGCKITDDNILGPFYKAGAPFQNDITDGEAGSILIVSGTVYGCDCVTPLEGAIVDVWQANTAGVYDSVGYTLRGKMQTGKDGKYELHTIMPGWYLNGSQYRPRHVHYKVSHPDGTALTTQLYFEGDPYIPIDPYVKPSLVMPFTQESDGDGGTIYRVQFDVVLA